MGTRNSTIVIQNKKVKVAQYGQWDGYPSGQGKTILNFLKSCDLDLFKRQIKELKAFTKKDLKALEKTNWQDTHPWLTRDWAAQILNGIHSGMMAYNDWSGDQMKSKIKYVSIDKVSLDKDFPGDSLFCEWAYVIDLDTNTFEIYEGFNQTPLTPSDRFFHLQKEDSEYYPVRLRAFYKLDNLPTKEEFLKLEETEQEVP